MVAPKNDKFALYEESVSRMVRLSDIFSTRDWFWSKEHLIYFSDLFCDHLDKVTPLVLLGVYLSQDCFSAFGRRDDAAAAHEQINTEKAIFIKFDIQTSSFSEEIEISEDDWYWIRWHDVRVCHNLDAPGVTEYVLGFKPASSLKRLFSRFILGDFFVQETRKKLSFDRHLLDLESAISVSDGKPPAEQWFDDWIIPPPWRQTDQEFFEAYWKIIKERNSATISDLLQNVPESVVRFIRAVRYPLSKIHLMLFKGELVARGDDKGFGERKLIPSLFWRREDISVDFQYSNIYSAAGELIWGDISLEAAASGGEIIGQSANTAEVTVTLKNPSVADENQYEPVPDAIRRKFKELSKTDAANMRAKITVRDEVIWNALMQEPQFSKMAKPSPNTFGNALSKIDRRRKTKR